MRDVTYHVSMCVPDAEGISRFAVLVAFLEKEAKKVVKRRYHMSRGRYARRRALSALACVFVVVVMPRIR